MAHYVTGKVKILYVDRNTCFIKLDYNSNHTNDPKPANEYFQLKRSHENYASLYSLALAAAVNDLELSVRSVGDIIAGQVTFVEYLVVGWA